MVTPEKTAASVRVLDLDKVLEDPKSKEYRDLRDRAAYVHLTGTIPSHLRTFMVQLLRKIASYSRARQSRPGPFAVDDKVIDALQLDDHPMIKKTRQLLAQGYKLQTSRGFKERRPYSRVFLFKGPEKMTVQFDGSIKEGW